MDAKSATGKATEVERSGTTSGLKKAAQRLKASGAKQKELKVPQPDMEKAKAAMKDVGVSGTISNIGGTKKKRT